MKSYILSTKFKELKFRDLEPSKIMPPKIPILLSSLFLILPFFFILSSAQLQPDFYDESCPRLPMIIRYRVWAAVQNDSRIAASLLRLQFHDCIVDVCVTKSICMLLYYYDYHLLDGSDTRGYFLRGY